MLNERICDESIIDWRDEELDAGANMLPFAVCRLPLPLPFELI